LETSLFPRQNRDLTRSHDNLWADLVTRGCDESDNPEAAILPEGSMSSWSWHGRAIVAQGMGWRGQRDMTARHGAPGGIHRSAGSLGTVNSVEDRPEAGSVTGTERVATIPIRSERSCHQRSVVPAMHRPGVPQQPASPRRSSRAEESPWYPSARASTGHRLRAVWAGPAGVRLHQVWAGVVGGRPFATGDRVAGRGTRSRPRVETGRGRGGRLPRIWREL